jgi:hypothetical protein
MCTSFRNGFYAGVLAAFIFGLWLVRLWGAENQVRLHSEHFLRSVEARDWSGFETFLAQDYGDAWENDRSTLVLRLRLLSRMLSSLTITTSPAQLQVAAPQGSWRSRIHLESRGEAAAEVDAKVNGLTTPFEFDWRRESWKPWDWKLIAVKNAGLNLPPGEY